MKIALLLFGQPRNIENPNSFKSHQEWIYDEYDVDTFCHVWWEKGVEGYDVSDWVNEECKAPENPIGVIEERYKPKKIKVESPRTFKLSDDLYKRTRDKFGYGHPWSEKTLSNVSSHLYSIETAARLIDNPNDYDFIIQSRYDNYIHNFPDLESMDGDHFYLSDHHPRFPDLMYIFSPKFIETQFTYGKMDELAERHFDKFWEPSAECYKYYNYLDKFFIQQMFPIHLPVRVIRDSTGYGDTSQLPSEYLQKLQ